MTEFGYNEPPSGIIAKIWQGIIICMGVSLLIVFGLVAWVVLSISEIGGKK